MGRLGFADLTENEAFLIAIYRDWRRLDLGKATIESNIRHALAHDTLNDVLSAVFATFRKLTPNSAEPCGQGDILSEHEERLLDALSARLRVACPVDADGGRAVPPETVRPCKEIVRSGTDDLLQKIHRTGWRVAAGI